MAYGILAVNPGSTSTKIAFYEDDTPVWTRSIEHAPETIAGFAAVFDQYQMRKELVLGVLAEQGTALSALCAVVGRGGLLPPVHAGAYRVNEAMLETLRERPVNEHASNLGAAIADAIARPLGIPAFIYDPVTVDEMIPLVKLTGLREIKRIGQGHNLNMRAAAIKYAASAGKPYDSLNLIVAHLGGGITLSLHSKGRIIDMISDDEGPFSPERAGGLPGFQLIKMATSGQYDYKSMMKKVQRQGGMMAYFGTSDIRAVIGRMEQGDQEAALVLEAMGLNVAKNIAKLSVVVNGEVDAILLTGGIAHSKLITNWIRERVRFIAPLEILAGENEMESLALGALRVLRGEEVASEYEG